MFRILVALVFLALIGPAKLSQAADTKAITEPKPAPVQAVTVPTAPTDAPAPYDAQLLRVSEIMGSLHYLRNLCLETKEDQWRTNVQQLIESETNNEPKRKASFTAAFNRGYRSFGSVYTTCTPVARVAAEQYRNEAATLVGEIVARFGN